eukprot:6206789-Pleurochrysis_carterae.AAC.7
MSALYNSQTWTAPLRKVIFRVGPLFADRVRHVCSEVFLAHFPTSLASLTRRIQENRVCASPSDRSNLSGKKSMESLSEYADELKRAGEANLMVSRTWLNHVVRIAPELSKIAISSEKENFGRCTTCGDLEEVIKSARFRGDGELVALKKQERLDHIMRERADKLAYLLFIRRFDKVPNLSHSTLLCRVILIHGYRTFRILAVSIHPINNGPLLGLRPLARAKATFWTSCVVDNINGKKTSAPGPTASSNCVLFHLKELACCMKFAFSMSAYSVQLRKNAKACRGRAQGCDEVARAWRRFIPLQAGHTPPLLPCRSAPSL